MAPVEESTLLPVFQSHGVDESLTRWHVGDRESQSKLYSLIMMKEIHLND